MGDENKKELTPEEKLNQEAVRLQIEANRLYKEKIERVSKEVMAILDREGMQMVIKQIIKFVPKQQ